MSGAYTEHILETYNLWLQTYEASNSFLNFWMDMATHSNCYEVLSLQI